MSVIIPSPIKYDNCKDCKSRCEHAGKDRKFICPGGVSCKVVAVPTMKCPHCGAEIEVKV